MSSHNLAIHYLILKTMLGLVVIVSWFNFIESSFIDLRDEEKDRKVEQKYIQVYKKEQK